MSYITIVDMWANKVQNRLLVRAVGLRVYKTFFMLNSAMFSKKEFAIVNKLRFISMKTFHAELSMKNVL